MILDANVLLYAVDADSSQHERAQEWLEARLAGSVRVGLPWQSLSAFLRISTHPRIYRQLPDTALAALAIEQGVTLVSSDTDFARFEELHWENPFAGRPGSSPS